jgi:hypothetical protein
MQAGEAIFIQIDVRIDLLAVHGANKLEWTVLH